MDRIEVLRKRLVAWAIPTVLAMMVISAASLPRLFPTLLESFG